MGDILPAILKTKAGEKLADAIKGAVGLGHNITDYVVGPKRIRSVAHARADAALIKANADVMVDAIRAQAAERLLDRELRNQRNIEAIAEQAFKALPPADEPVSDKPVSEDFVYRFFEECEGIGDAQMQQIWGKLLAGEVMRPGTFHPRTLRIVKDMQPADAQLFETLCRFMWFVGDFTPLVFNVKDTIYQEAGLDFRRLKHLDSLELISFESLTGFARERLPPKFAVVYGKQVVEIEIAAGRNLKTGKVMLTEAGRQLAELSSGPVMPGFFEYVVAKWREDGHVVNFEDATAPMAKAS